MKNKNKQIISDVKKHLVETLKESKVHKETYIEKNICPFLFICVYIHKCD